MPRRTVRRAAVAAASVLLLAAAAPALAAVAPTPGSVSISGSPAVLTVDGAPFKIKGVAYSPVPVGESVHFAPYGDYFTPSYVYIWSRDLPALRALGVNTLRIYGWDQTVDHTAFLDACSQYGLKVMLTHFVGSISDTPVDTPERRQSAIDKFVKHVTVLGDHPAILAWSFGNELNGKWNGFKSEFSKLGSCDWDDCENIQAEPGSKCHTAQTCMYTGLFGWLNDAIKAAKAVTTRPITSTFADVDYMIGTAPAMDRIPRFDSLLPAMDMYAIQLYRGQTFGDYFANYQKETSKPLLVGEYGVDAFNDPCGWIENYNSMRPCYNYLGQPGAKGGADVETFGGGCTDTNNGDGCLLPGVTAQANWDTSLAKEILAAPSNLGGILMEWHDENWKNIGTQDHCETTCTDAAACAAPGELHDSFAMGAPKGCTYKAHVTCSNFNTKDHDLCGYWLYSAPDHYVNEAWFGLNGATDCDVGDVYGGHRLSAMTPRPVISAMTAVFGGTGGADAAPRTCAQLQPCWQCSIANSPTAIMAGACNTQCGINLGDGAPLDASTAPEGEVIGSTGSSGVDTTTTPPSTTTPPPVITPQPQPQPGTKPPTTTTPPPTTQQPDGTTTTNSKSAAGAVGVSSLSMVAAMALGMLAKLL